MTCTMDGEMSGDVMAYDVIKRSADTMIKTMANRPKSLDSPPTIHTAMAGSQNGAQPARIVNKGCQWHCYE